MQSFVIKHGAQSTVIQVPQPKIVVSPPKVVVNSPTPPDWLAYDVPIASVLLAFVAALFAILGWLRMQRQIDLANKQIAQQDRAIALSIKDYEATVAALEITQRQAELADKERARLPDFRLFLNGEQNEVWIPWGRPGLIAGTYSFRLRVELGNYGPVSAHHPRLVMVLPNEWIDESSMRGEHDVSALSFDTEKTANGRTKELEPGAIGHLGNVYAAAPPGKYRLEWYATSEEEPRDYEDGFSLIVVEVDKPRDESPESQSNIA